MKPKIFLSTFFILLILSISIPLNANAQTIRNHSVTVSSDVSSIKIPLIGTLTTFMKYTIDFEVIKPDIIDAGTMEKITLFPKNGVLATTFYLNGEKIKTIEKNIPIGSTTTIPIPGTFVGEVYASPSLVVGMGVKGPSSPNDYVRLNSLSPKDFPIYVNNEIGNSNSVTVNFPMRIELDVGGKINLQITEIPISVGTIPIEVNNVISETIPLRKYYSTSTSLQVMDSSNPGYIQVYPTVKASSGENVYSSNISVYVDGEYKATVGANGWSDEIYTGSGQKFVQLKFPETKSSSNSAIIYKSSEASQRFDVKYPPSIATPQVPAYSSGSGNVGGGSEWIFILGIVVVGVAIGVGLAAHKRKKQKQKIDSMENPHLEFRDEKNLLGMIQKRLSKGEISVKEFQDLKKELFS